MADIAETFGISRSHAYTVGKSGQVRARLQDCVKKLENDTRGISATSQGTSEEPIKHSKRAGKGFE